MSVRCAFTPKAQADLDHIWQDSADRWGTNQAAAYLRQIVKSAEGVAERPELGRPCPDIRPGYRRLRSGSHILFYRELADGIEIVRVRHERMDLGRHL